MKEGRPICEDDLHAWADGRLDAARRAEVDAWLAEDPARAARVAEWRQSTELLHHVYDGVLDEPIPSRLRAAVVDQPRRPRLRAAAAVGWLVIGGVIGGGAGYRLGQVEPMAVAATPALPQRAAIAHAVYSPEVRHPVEVGAEQEQHLVAWLSKRLGAPVKVPYLGAQGYNLLGGRLLPAEAGPSAQFMYENAAGHRLTLYLGTGGEASSPSAFRYAVEDGIGVFYWADGGFAYALSGELSRETLLPLADAVYRQLAP